ncbi:hypothetical protein QJQ45_008658 [Haematococcus lacustris]|nr:hypothetical protein QJQ45_008658 [Haematococcus lacustris]
MAAAQAVWSPALDQFFKKEEEMAEASMERYDCAKQLVVSSGAAGIGTCGGWDAAAVLRTCCKVVCGPKGSDQPGGGVVLVEELRTSRLEPTRPAGWKPPAGQTEQDAEPTQPTKGKGKGMCKAAKPSPG